MIESFAGRALIVGITSYGAVPGLASGCPIKKPTAFTNVAKYTDWIKNITETVHHVDPSFGLVFFYKTEKEKTNVSSNIDCADFSPTFSVTRGNVSYEFIFPSGDMSNLAYICTKNMKFFTNNRICLF